MQYAVGYCRLSDRKERSQSIPSQKKDIAEYCFRNDLTLLQTFVDDGKSGWTFDRPGFKDLEAFCKKNPKVKYLIIPHFDRFSRADPIDAMVKERHFRDKLGVKVLQISEAADLDTNNPMHQMMRFMQAFAANQERIRTVDRVKKNLRFRLLQGRYSTTAPFGYINGRDDKGFSLLKIDEAKAPIIRFIYDQFLKGAGIEEVRRAAEKKGYSNKGNSAIQRVLTNPVYAGLILVPAAGDQPSKIINGLHEPIIKESDYWEVQQILSPRKFTPQKREEVPLRGILRCQYCSKLLTAAPSKGRMGKYYWYYFCNEHRKENFSAVKVHELFDRILNYISIKEPEFSKLKNRITSLIQNLIDSQTKELMKLNLQISKLNQSIVDIEKRFLIGGIVSEKTFQQMITEKRMLIADLENRKEMHSQNAGDYLTRLDVILNGASSVRTIYEGHNLIGKQRFIRQIFGEKIYYTRTGVRTLYLHPVFAINKKAFNELPLVIEGANIISKPEVDLCGGNGGATEPISWEDVKSFFEMFAA